MKLPLNKIVRKAVDKAMALLEDATTTVLWNFQSVANERYDILTDTVSQRGSLSLEQKVVIYPRQDKDNVANFSSTGIYVDPPAKLETGTLLLPYTLLQGEVPSNRDSFEWDDYKFKVDSVEYIPTQAIYLVDFHKAGPNG
jgi:hypothetical protein